MYDRVSPMKKSKYFRGAVLDVQQLENINNFLTEITTASHDTWEMNPFCIIIHTMERLICMQGYIFKMVLKHTYSIKQILRSEYFTSQYCDSILCY